MFQRDLRHADPLLTAMSQASPHKQSQTNTLSGLKPVAEKSAHDRARQFHFPNAERVITSKRINFADLDSVALEVYEMWFDDHDEQDYADARQRSYFRINHANLKNEISWRTGKLPF